MVIYRKYRPQNFSEIIGQKNVVQILENEIKNEKVAHAYLFTGPRGLGKTSISRILAKSINCLNRKKGESEPCNQCENCEAVNRNRFMDLIELDAASQTGVDNVRENIIKYARIAPSRGKYKIFVIDECHMLSISAFNALLKTLEEPPEYVIFILATTELHKLPETIVSRCQRFDFNKVSLDEIVKRLERITKKEKVKVEEKVLETIAVRSEGCVRDAESLLSQILSLDGKIITEKEAFLVLPPTQTDSILKLLELVFKKQTADSIKNINQLLEEGINLEQFVTDLIEILRKMLLYKVGSIEKIDRYWHLDKGTQKKIEDLSGLMELKELIFIIEEFIKTKIQFSYSEIPQLPLELAVLRICEKKE